MCGSCKQKGRGRNQAVRRQRAAEGLHAREAVGASEVADLGDRAKQAEAAEVDVALRAGTVRCAMPVKQAAWRACVADSSLGRVALERDTLWTRCKRQT